MLNIAIKSRPNFVCIVPEKRKELTTEGGLNIKKNIKILKRIINKLKKNKIRVSLFVEPLLSNVDLAFILGVNSIEIHTGIFCDSLKKKNKKKTEISYSKIKQCANYAKNFSLGVHAGHGLNYESARRLSKIEAISEFNIGHFIIAESIFISLRNSIKKFKRIINN